ncbi:hypothetical protein SCUP234_06961 [Seiridium cupressi]
MSKLQKRGLGTSREIVAATCRHESHAPKHGTDPNPPDGLTHPTAIVSKTTTGSIHLRLRWLGHLHIPNGADEVVNGVVVGVNDIKQASPSFMQKQLEKLRLGAAEFIAPAVGPGRLMEMSCFDPNKCACLRYSGSEHLSQQWQLTPLQEIGGLTCCSEPDLRLAALKVPRATANSHHMKWKWEDREYHLVTSLNLERQSAEVTALVRR